MFAPIHHKLEGMAADRFRSFAGQLQRLQKQGASAEHLDTICRDEVEWARFEPGLQSDRKKYEASVRLLTDLAKLRWRIVLDGFGIELAAPNARRMRSLEVTTYKDAVRQELSSQLRQQFSGKAVREFIRRMEVPAPSAQKRSVLELIADGRELRSRLLPASEASGVKREQLCQTAVQPYLQLVEPDTTDRYTGLQLSDIWRYFRYTWSIPATNVPGRNLFYLIRDAAHSTHAVMGITALSNAPLALRDRDNAIGWTASETQARASKLALLPEAEARTGLATLLHDLEANIQIGLDSISHDELLLPREAAEPTEDVIQRLRWRAAEFAERRASILGDWELPVTVSELEEPTYGEPDVSDDVLSLESKVYGNETMDAARRALTAKKRAAELARLLQARLALKEQRERLLSPKQAPAAYSLESVAMAVNAAWVSAKNARAGTAMLELTVCGAVQPYNEILGGKLAALLMLSPEVADDYTRRYGRSVSIISSMMKNERVIKDTRLVFVGTTSLYRHGASQYNRVRLPAATISPQQTEIRYEPLGETGGFGTVQFGPETIKAIEEVDTTAKGFRQVNSVFGEGRSPKLRKLRSGLEELGFDPEILLKHHQPRIIYGAKLCEDAAEFLRTEGGTLPDFIKDPGTFRNGTTRIVNYWSQRWLCRRLDHSPVLEKLAMNPAWCLSQMIPVEDTPISTDFSAMDSVIDAGTPPPEPAGTTPSIDTRLWESLAAAGHDSCSDCVTENDLERLHVPSPLEDFLVDKVREGYSIILTGNAGDGKTHILRRIASRLSEAGALVDEDATAVMRKGSVGPILDRWRSALNAGRPYCLAANEYPLHLLIQSGRGLLPDPLHDELARQTRDRLAYFQGVQPSEAAREHLLVLDLSLRNPLLPPFSLTALKRMLSDPAVQARAAAGTDQNFTWNHRQLSRPRVQERLGGIVSQAGRTWPPLHNSRTLDLSGASLVWRPRGVG